MLNDHLTHTLGGAHNRSGVHRLVGRDEDKAANAVLVSKAHSVQRAKHVVLNRLARAYLHKGHVLMRSCMEHGCGMILLKNVAQTALVAHATNLDLHVDIVVLRHDFIAKHVGIVFVHVEHHDAFRGNGSNLTAQFGSNRAAATGNKNSFAGNITAHNARVQNDLFAAEQVGDVDLAQLDVVDFVDTQLAHIGKRAQLAIRFGANAINALALVERGRGNGHNDLLDIEALDQTGNIVARSHDLDTVNAKLTLAGIVIDRDNRIARHMRIARSHATNRERARFARTDDQRAQTFLVFCRRSGNNALLGTNDAEYHAHAAREENHQEQRDEVNTNGNPLAEHPQQHGGNQRSKADHDDNANRIVDRSVFPKVVVHLECGEQADIHNCWHAENEIDFVSGKHFAHQAREHRCQVV